MASFIHHLMRLFAPSTKSDLLRQITYLKEENRILRAKLPARVHVTLAERRRLVKLGTAVGTALQVLISIVSYRTFQRWMSHRRRQVAPAKRGRRSTPHQIRDLILKLARENDWGYTRIRGEPRAPTGTGR